MSVNFGYGNSGMMNGMMMNSAMGETGSRGNTFQEMKQKYGCSHCYQYGTVPYNYQLCVNPLQPNTTEPSFLYRLFRKIMGG